MDGDLDMHCNCAPRQASVRQAVTTGRRVRLGRLRAILHAAPLGRDHSNTAQGLARSDSEVFKRETTSPDTWKNRSDST